MTKILIFGDSITAGAWDTEGGWANRLISYLHSKNIKDENFYCMTYNLGVSGDCLQDINNRFEEEVKVRMDDDEEELFIILAVGTNDAQLILSENKLKFQPDKFKKELEKFYNIINKLSAKLLILGPSCVDEDKVDPIPWTPNFSYKNENIKVINNLIKDWANKNNYSYINLFNLWINIDFKLKLSDGVHPNTLGHLDIFKLVVNNLEKIKLNFK